MTTAEIVTPEIMIQVIADPWLGVRDSREGKCQIGEDKFRVFRNGEWGEWQKLRADWSWIP